MYKSISVASESQKGSHLLKTGTIRSVNNNIVHPHTKLDLESSNKIVDKICSKYSISNRSTDIESYRRLMKDAYMYSGNDYTPSDEDVMDFIQHHDRDGDGIVSGNDLKNVCSHYLCGPAGTGMSLDRKDDENSDLISYFKQVIENTRDIPDQVHAIKMFEKYDSDGDGVLSKDEIRRMMIDTYKILNKDKMPTDEEINKHFGTDLKMSKQTFLDKILGSMSKRKLFPK